MRSRLIILIFLTYYLEERIFWKMFQGKLSLARVPRIGLSQHGVSITRHDLAGLQSLPDEVLQLLFGVFITDLLTKFLQPKQHLKAIQKLSCGVVCGVSRC